MKLWQVDILSADGQPDALGAYAGSAAREMGISKDLDARGVHGFLLQGSLDQAAADRVANDYLADPIAQRTIAAPVGSPVLSAPKPMASRTDGSSTSCSSPGLWTRWRKAPLRCFAG